MRKLISFHPAAAQEAEEVIAWYAERSTRTADRFLDELERLVDLIATGPERFHTFDPGLRRAIFRRFPYYVVFRSDDKRIEVLAVAHGKRRPGYWGDRVAKR